MADHSGKGEHSFKTNIEMLLDELNLAFQWKRPSLLLTIHKSSIGQHKAQEALAKKLNLAGHPVVEIRIDESDPDAARSILQASHPNDCVFFVAGLDRGGGSDGMDAYRALNLARETFVENQWKVVFWLTANEAANITRRAPDFWAFRHRVIEFASSAPHITGTRLTALLTWHGADLPASLDALMQKIESQEKLLADLPNTPDSLSLRIETCYLIGRASWAAGNPDQALKLLMAGIGLAQEKDFAPLSTWLLNGIAILRHARGRHQETLDILQDLVSHDPDEAIVGMNLAVALCSVGKNYEGIAQANRAINKKNADPRLILVLGHLYMLLGRLDEAVTIFEKAAGLMPRRAEAHEALAACYLRMELLDEALVEIRTARQYTDEPYDRPAILEQGILGETENAIKLLTESIATGKVAKSSIKYDTNLNSIIDPELIAEAI